MNLRDKLDRYAPASGLTKTPPDKKTRPSLSAECERLLYVFPPEHTHGRLRVDSIGGRFQDAARMLRRYSWEGTLDFERMAFLDTETTGISGGIGVCAFLIGIGYRSPAGFVVEQFLMNDFPAEPDMLGKASELLEKFEVIVSYNGLSFDVPILDGRLLLNGIQKKLSDTPHLDLLHPARRLWKHRLNDCSLKSVEAQALGYTRMGDIEGWMIPETFFGYLRSGDRELLEPIMEHNRLDLLSLACLTHLMLEAIDSPRKAPLRHGLDWYGLGTLLEQHRRMEEAIHCFKHAIEIGLPDETKQRCLRTLSLTHKRTGDWENASRLWMEASGIGDNRNSLFALEELAKFYEHRRRDLFSAREICRRAIAMLEIEAELSEVNPAQQLERFEYRLRRIERKIQGKKDA